MPALSRPSERDDLLLRAALSPPSDGAGAWARASRTVDLGALDASSHDLLPLLYRTLAAAGVEDPWLGRLKGVYRRTWYSNQLLLRRAGEALGALRAEGVEAMVLGGAAVGLLHYRELGARLMSDTSIAVRPASAGRARRVLSAAGWHARPVSSGDEDRWTASVPLDVADVRTCAPCPGDQLLRTCAYGASLSSRRGSCRWVADALVIIESSPDGIDWQRLAKRAIDQRVVSHLHLTLSYLRDAFAAPVPAGVVESLGAATTPIGVGRLHLSRGRQLVRAIRSS